MKIKCLVFSLILLFPVLFWSCKGDGVEIPPVKSDPVINLHAETLHTVQGRTIRLEGKVLDEVGLKSINLKNANWFLDKTIAFDPDSLIKDYNMWYDFKVPQNVSNSDDKVTITVTNVGSRSVSKSVTVRMDGDFVPPVLNVTSPAEGATIPPKEPNPLDIACSLSDTRRLGYFVVKESSLHLYDSVSFSQSAVKTFEYKKTFNLSSNPQLYQFNFMLADSAGNITQKKVALTVSADFAKMYLSDVKTESELTSDLFGVPMLIDKVAPFVFSAKYYAEKANTEIKFVPQKASFSPHCYGVDPNNPQKLINSPTLAKPIILPNKGYYKIDFDLNKMEYKVTPYTPTDKPYSDYMNLDENDMNNYVGPLCLVGCGWTDFKNTTGWGWDGTNANKAMTVDPENPYLWKRTEELEGKFELIFDGYHPWGWWPEPFWRFDNKTEPEKTVLKGGDNLSIMVPAKAKYEIVFDTHLNRAKAVRVQ